MSKKIIFILITIIVFVTVTTTLSAQNQNNSNKQYISYIADPHKQDLKLYWKDDKTNNLRSILNLRTWLQTKHKTLVFAMNAGMYQQDNSPLGLFIENKKIIAHLNTANGNGNFYLKPNGVFYITTNNLAVICNTTDFIYNDKIKYATQSGPMLIMNSKIHPAFKQGSANLNIRNGVGILPNNKVLFAQSKIAVSLYDFAAYFKSMGCINALYLDGFVSRTYLPAQNWMQLDGNFGVMIGVTEKH